MDTDNPAPAVQGLRLPAELERVIFKIAALSRPVTIPKLMLVAWRVKEWVGPLLYRVVMVADRGTDMGGFPTCTVDLLLRVIADRSPEFFHNATKHLFLEIDNASQADTILSACSGVTHLLMYDLDPPVPALWALRHLRQLTLDFDIFMEPPIIGYVCATLRNLTHLTLCDLCDDDWRVEGLPARLALMPDLTHIAFDPAPVPYELYIAIQANTHLHYIVFLSRPPKVRWFASDDRFIFVKQGAAYRDWLRGAHEGKDYWTLAESFIAARRAGKVKRTVFVTSANDAWRALKSQ
ncbi:hypothetical protein B0H19DRAFT_1262415 [Mycena capillaripes]|nr:hypothetical protein B0H19DRAFT_1262415 [Mycena capillaripes]